MTFGGLVQGPVGAGAGVGVTGGAGTAGAALLDGRLAGIGDAKYSLLMTFGGSVQGPVGFEAGVPVGVRSPGSASIGAFRNKLRRKERWNKLSNTRKRLLCLGAEAAFGSLSRKEPSRGSPSSATSR